MKLHRIKALILNYYYFSIDSLDRLFDVFYWPIMDLFIWGFMTFYIQGLSEYNVLNTILGGIVLWIFIWRSSQDMVVYILESFWSRSVYHLFSSPVQFSEIVASLFFLGIIRSLAAFLTMAVVSFLLYQFNVFAFNLLHFIMFVSILFLFAWAVGLLVSSFIFRYGTRLQVLAWSTIWIIQPFSCVFYPLSSLPSWAAKIAILLPTTHVFEQLRASIAGQPIDYYSLLYSLIVSIVFLIVAAFIAARALEKAKVSGSLAKAE
ncbi:hypothetical protein COV20_05530 [Candidatus Woesearchaeota archaeon CG10_big_fil_rev_8_21_14_0_10_45_16]|nr:MAG: hypothetical protein COV20_05530 [Candidatus Woesearchaeota archaeon CG10_big_fil_rev_8_21_14_0_10_45_16]